MLQVGLARKGAFKRHWESRIDALARGAWTLTLIAVAFGLAAGFVTAATGIGGERGVYPGADYRPPLFFVTANLLYAVAVLLGAPALLTFLAALRRQEFALTLRRLLLAVGPAIVWFGIFEGSHLIGCAGGYLCEAGSGNFTGRVHLLHHTAVAAFPLAIVVASLKLALLKLAPQKVATTARAPDRAAR
jgi:hypothetical protein